MLCSRKYLNESQDTRLLTDSGCLYIVGLSNIKISRRVLLIGHIFISMHLWCGVNVFPPEHAIVQGHGCVVVDELQNLQTCHLRRLQDCPALCLVEEGWDGDHRVFDRLFCEFKRLGGRRRGKKKKDR